MESKKKMNDINELIPKTEMVLYVESKKKMNDINELIPKTWSLVVTKADEGDKLVVWD